MALGSAQLRHADTCRWLRRLEDGSTNAERWHSECGVGHRRGTLVCALAASLIDRYGWRTTYVVFAVGGMSALLVASVGAVTPPALLVIEAWFNFGRWSERRFITLHSASLITTMALFVPFVFIKTYATDRGVPSASPAALIGLIGASSIVGRLGLGARSQGRPIHSCESVLMAGSCDLARRRWSLRSTRLVCGGSRRRLWRVHCIVTVAVAVMFGTNGMATILGATYTGAGIGGLIGPPLAGAIIDGSGFNAGITCALLLQGCRRLCSTRCQLPA